MTSQTGLPDSLLFQDRQRGRGSHPLLCGETNYSHNTSPTTARVKLWGHLVTLDSQRLSENQNSFPSWGANRTVHLCKYQETRLALIYFYGERSLRNVKISLERREQYFREQMRYFGKCFVRYFTHYGYDQFIKSSGRYYRDFLVCVDYTHNQMKFSYPKVSKYLFILQSFSEIPCNST